LRTQMLDISGAFKNVTVDGYQDYCKVIGCSYFDVVRLEKNVIAIIDDEGLLKPNFFWMHRNYPNPLAGPALFFGSDEAGDEFELEWEDLVRIHGDIKMVDAHILQHIAKTHDPLDFRPYVWDEAFKNCFEKCDYSSTKAGECRCHNNAHEKMEAQCPF